MNIRSKGDTPMPENIALHVTLAIAEQELSRLVGMKKANAAEMFPPEMEELVNRTINEDISRVKAHISEIKDKDSGD